MLFHIKSKKKGEDKSSSTSLQSSLSHGDTLPSREQTPPQSTAREVVEAQAAAVTENGERTDNVYRAPSGKGSQNQVLFGDMNLNLRNIAIIGGILVFGFYIYKSATGDGVLIQQNGMTTRRNVMIWIDVVIATSLAFLIIKFSRTLLRGI